MWSLTNKCIEIKLNHWLNRIMRRKIQPLPGQSRHVQPCSCCEADKPSYWPWRNPWQWLSWCEYQGLAAASSLHLQLEGRGREGRGGRDQGNTADVSERWWKKSTVEWTRVKTKGEKVKSTAASSGNPSYSFWDISHKTTNVKCVVKRQGITKVVRIHHQGTMNIYTKFQ